MKKIAIIVDSSTYFTDDELKTLGNVTVAPLSIVYDGKEYVDQIELTYEDVNDLLRENKVLKTSQPNLGRINDIYETHMSEGYDHIFVLSLSSHLSGTFSAFNQVKDLLEIPNMTIIDSQTLVGPIRQAVRKLNAWNEAGLSIEEMTAQLEEFFNHSSSFLYPENLKQLKASGRISGPAATLASLLKVKPLLYLELHGTTIDKFGTGRTETKIFEMMVKEFETLGVSPETHFLSYLHSEAEETVQRVRAAFNAHFGTFDDEIIILPAALSVHAGIGTIAVQWALK